MPVPLGSPLRSRVESTVCRIANDLRERPGTLYPAGGFSNGTVGAALFFAHAHRALPQHGFDATAAGLLADAAQALEVGGFSAWINGFPSGALMAKLAGGMLADPGVFVALEEYDARLLETLEAGELDDSKYDPLHGWSGVLLYAAHRAGTELGEQLAAMAYERLRDSSRQDEDGSYWTELPEHFAPARIREFGDPSIRPFMEAALLQHPDGRVNLGLAHGNAGVIGALSAAVHAGCVPPEAADLLGQASDWLLVQRRSDPSLRCAFPSFKGGDGNSRNAWCYGDPGVFLQLFHAAKVLQRPDLAKAAHDVALLAARRDAKDGMVHDAGLCHGSAGLAQIFRRAFQYTGDPVLGATAQEWIEYTLNLEQAPGAADAFVFLVNAGTMDPVGGLLEGCSGVGLALLAAIDDGPTEWDRAMLMSI
jgi:hypothetical protein